MKPMEDVSDLFQIAFGYMASKALFTAVSIGVFDVLDSSSKSLAEIQKTIGGEPEAVKTLIAALTAIGLIARKDEMFSNSPVAQLPLTKSGGSQFSKYLNMQVDQLMYPMLQHLTDALKGNRDQVPYYDYEDWFRNTDEANTYSEAQHAVSQGVANALLQAASESEQIVRAVRKNGNDVWYLLFDDEGHGFRKKPNQVITLFPFSILAI